MALASKRAGFHVTGNLSMGIGKRVRERNSLAYVNPTHMFWCWIGEQNGPLSGSVPLISQAVNSLGGIPGLFALAAAAAAGSVYEDVKEVVEEVFVVLAEFPEGVLVSLLVALTP